MNIDDIFLIEVDWQLDLVWNDSWGVAFAIIVILRHRNLWAFDFYILDWGHGLILRWLSLRVYLVLQTASFSLERGVAALHLLLRRLFLDDVRPFDLLKDLIEEILSLFVFCHRVIHHLKWGRRSNLLRCILTENTALSFTLNISE